jgi:DNA polymerase III subunit delta'
MARRPSGLDIEVLPEADRLEGFPHPRETYVLFGHDAAEQTLLETFSGGHMHHAWLLAGPAGIGKATLAYRLARHALAGPDERDPGGARLDVQAGTPTVRQIAALSHPSLLVLRRPYEPKTKRFVGSIPVDEVRKLRSFLGLTAGGQTWRVVIVDQADELNLSAANALLKSLEEPPRRAMFLLVASEPSRLLPTIRSRCRRLNLRPLAPEPLKRAVTGALHEAQLEPPAASQWQQITHLAGGSVRRALTLSANGGLELYSHVDRLFSNLPNIDWSAAHALSDALATSVQHQQFEAFFDLFLDRLAGALRGQVTGQGTPGTAMLFTQTRLPDWAELWDATLRDKADAAELNLDRKALIMRTIVRLQNVAKT